VPLLNHCYSSIHPSKRASVPLRLEPVGLPAGPTEVRECQALVLLAQQLSIGATCSRRLCCGSRLPRDVHHKVRSTSAGRVDLDQQPGSAHRHRYRVDGSSCPASQVLAVRVAGRRHRCVACQSDLRAFAVPRARRASSACWRRPSRCCSASVALSDGWWSTVIPPLFRPLLGRTVGVRLLVGRQVFHSMLGTPGPYFAGRGWPSRSTGGSQVSAC
jgi:hypothetical protein